jgi:hypothetical protein
VQYLLPGVIVMNVLLGASVTAAGMAEDLRDGIVDRFRSLPMSHGTHVRHRPGLCQRRARAVPRTCHTSRTIEVTQGRFRPPRRPAQTTQLDRPHGLQVGGHEPDDRVPILYPRVRTGPTHGEPCRPVDLGDRLERTGPDGPDETTDQKVSAAEPRPPRAIPVPQDRSPVLADGVGAAVPKLTMRVRSPSPTLSAPAGQGRFAFLTRCRFRTGVSRSRGPRPLR